MALNIHTTNWVHSYTTNYTIKYMVQHLMNIIHLFYLFYRYNFHKHVSHTRIHEFLILNYNNIYFPLIHKHTNKEFISPDLIN